MIATAYKAGTTWTQNICLHLVFQDFQVRQIGNHSPWLDNSFRDSAEIIEKLEAQTHRRIIKSHMYFDGLRIWPDLKYIHVARDPRDIFMSLWNFYTHFGDETYETIERLGHGHLPRPPATPGELFDIWISQGEFEGEDDGVPFWSCLHQMRTWWPERHRENVLFLHYADMKADLRREVGRIANFLEIEADGPVLDRISHMCEFSSMKKVANQLEGDASDLKGGGDTFFHKGTNGRWAKVLTSAQLDSYEKVASEVLTPDAKRWMEDGGPTDSV